MVTSSKNTNAMLLFEKPKKSKYQLHEIYAVLITTNSIEQSTTREATSCAAAR
jgi:hypothetical protein